MSVFADILAMPGNAIRWPGEKYSKISKKINKHGFGGYLYKQTLEGAIGTSRSYMTSYVILQRVEKKEGVKSKEEVGAFVLGLYQLAELGFLTPQRQLQSFIADKKVADGSYQFDPKALQTENPELFDQLFRVNAKKDIVEKSLFELAVLPTTDADKIVAMTRSEYAAQHQHGGRIPQPYFRARLGDFLDKKELAKHNLKMGKSFSPDISLPTKDYPPSKKEEFLHYASQWMGFFMLSAAVLLAGTVHPFLAVAGMLVIWKEKHGTELGWWSTAESFLQDWNWLSRDNFTWKKFSFKQAFNFATTVAMLGFFAYIGGVGMYQSMMGLTNLPAAIQPFLAATTAVGAAIGAFWGGVGSIRLLSNWLSVNDNTIQLPSDLEGVFKPLEPAQKASPLAQNEVLKQRVAELEKICADNHLAVPGPAPEIAPGYRVMAETAAANEAAPDAHEEKAGLRKRANKRK